MKSLAAAIALLIAATNSAAAEEACSSADIRVNVKAPISAASRTWFEEELRQARRKVCDWWGASFTGPITIDVSERDGPSMALIPAWRGERGLIVFPASLVRRRRAATVHETVHVYAPNANRFLAEGLAVYAHEKLGGPVAYPNFGASLHEVAKPYAQADIAAFDRLATPDRLMLDRLSDKEAYIVAGSFVRFLIEQHGLDKLRRLYATTPLVARQRNAGVPTRWRDIYGFGLDQLSRSWQATLTKAL